MPTGKNWIYFIYVNLGFALYIAGTYYITSLKDIKNNWSLYRCNPMYMPLSDNIESDFVYCVQNMTKGIFGNLVQPLTYLTSSLTNITSSFTTEINSVRGMIDKIRTFMSSIVQSIFGVFLNLIIEFEKIIIGMKDLIGKTIGIMVTMMYVLDSSMLTMQSAWNGPSGQLVRALGKCFHPETKLKLKNGKIVYIKDINLGDILEDDSVVYSTMKIKNDNEKIYLLKGQGVNNEDIYVTGSHLVFDIKKQEFILVEKYSKAILSNIKLDWFSCLITDTHTIKIGSELFYDWEDHFIKYKKLI
jgi:hypothetical protein